mmetsp:Transcript_11481/g.35446  ORF Transcript_11481/g.35446 Transcript_11481/m.35446 type:complete len:225 (-) Transcript_11481:541-1215(-)|eukprot:scaffold232456_cov33-Tisochrysis_lutea.AAC.5
MPRRCALAARSPPASCWQPSNAPSLSISVSSAQIVSAGLVLSRPTSSSTFWDTPPVKSTSISVTRPLRSASYEPWYLAYALMSSAKESCRGSTQPPKRTRPATVGMRSSVITACHVSHCQIRTASTPCLECSPGTKQRASISGDCAITARAPNTQLPALGAPPTSAPESSIRARSSSRGANIAPEDATPSGPRSPAGTNSLGRSHLTFNPSLRFKEESASTMIR